MTEATIRYKAPEFEIPPQFSLFGGDCRIKGIALCVTGIIEPPLWYVVFKETVLEEDCNIRKAYVAVKFPDAVKLLEGKKIFDRMIIDNNSFSFNGVSSEHGTYQHFKGNRYKVEAICFCPTSDEWFVYYRPCYERAIAESFVRTVHDFKSPVIFNNTDHPRFVRVE